MSIVFGHSTESKALALRKNQETENVQHTYPEKDYEFKTDHALSSIC